MWEFKKRCWSRIFSIKVRIGKSLLVKCSQALGSWMKKSSLLYFCKFLCTIGQKIWFFLERAKPRLEFKIKFNQYNMRSFHRALVGWSSLLIHLILREFNWVSISRIPNPPFQMGSWIRYLWGWIFCLFHRKSWILFSISFLFKNILGLYRYDLHTTVLIVKFGL